MDKSTSNCQKFKWKTSVNLCKIIDNFNNEIKWVENKDDFFKCLIFFFFFFFWKRLSNVMFFVLLDWV